MSERLIALDTETTGLSFQNGDKLIEIFLGSSAGLEHGKSVIRAFQRVDRCPGNRGSGRRQLFGRGEGVSGAGAEKRRRRDLRQVTVPRLVGFPGGWRG